MKKAYDTKFVFKKIVNNADGWEISMSPVFSTLKEVEEYTWRHPDETRGAELVFLHDIIDITEMSELPSLGEMAERVRAVRGEAIIGSLELDRDRPNRAALLRIMGLADANGTLAADKDLLWELGGSEDDGAALLRCALAIYDPMNKEWYDELVCNILKLDKITEMNVLFCLLDR